MLLQHILKKANMVLALFKAKNIMISDSKLDYFKQKNSFITINDKIIPDTNCNKYKKICNSIEQ